MVYFRSLKRFRNSVNFREMPKNFLSKQSKCYQNLNVSKLSLIIPECKNTTYPCIFKDYRDLKRLRLNKKLEIRNKK